ncbi:MAG TPA: helix-turn-helix domain-containing protein [Ohtaekwangia sp.]|nr:helix-turn-helix domain-containing protein [Ohtaekwangia sp.]
MSFGENLRRAREKKGFSQQQLADRINAIAKTTLKRNTISSYESGNSHPSFTLLVAMVEVLDVSADELLGIAKERNASARLEEKKGAKKYSKKAGNRGEVAEVSEAYLPRIVDTSGLALIPIVDIRDAAEDGYINPDGLDESQILRLPTTMLQSGNHLCIRVKGPSMAPTLQDGGYLVIRHLDQSEWPGLRSGEVYVIADAQGKTYLSRITNHFSSGNDGFIICMSDSPDKFAHPNFNLGIHDIRHIWYAEWYFTARMPNVHEQSFTRVSNLEEKVDLLNEEIRSLQKRLK